MENRDRRCGHGSVMPRRLLWSYQRHDENRASPRTPVSDRFGGERENTMAYDVNPADFTPELHHEIDNLGDLPLVTEVPHQLAVLPDGRETVVFGDAER